jgi:hypothetical protein
MAKYLVLRDGTVPLALTRVEYFDAEDIYDLETEDGNPDVRIVNGPNRGDAEGWYVMDVDEDGALGDLYRVESLAFSVDLHEVRTGLHLAGTFNKGEDNESYVHVFYLQP